ncbi:hypothetical protein HK405_009758, partial [Cladochytrium tenue]
MVTGTRDAAEAAAAAAAARSPSPPLSLLVAPTSPSSLATDEAPSLPDPAASSVAIVAPPLQPLSATAVSVSFILPRSTLDVPLPGWAAPAPSRPLAGILRVSVPSALYPRGLRVDRVQIELCGSFNRGVRDSSPAAFSASTANAAAATTATATPLAAGGSTARWMVSGGAAGGPAVVPPALQRFLVSKSLVVWEPRDAAEYDAGFSPGIHDFPFSIPVPMHALPTYDTRIPATYTWTELFAARSYELTAIVVTPQRRPGSGTGVGGASHHPLAATVPITIRQSMPPWQLDGHELRLGRGYTARGELRVRVAVPRLGFLPCEPPPPSAAAFHQHNHSSAASGHLGHQHHHADDDEVARDSVARVYLWLYDAKWKTRNVEAVRATLSVAKSSPSSPPVVLPINAPVVVKIPPESLLPEPYISDSNPLYLEVPYVGCRPDLHSPLVDISHTLTLEIFCTPDPSAPSATRKPLDAQVSIIVPKKMFFSRNAGATASTAVSADTVSAPSTSAVTRSAILGLGSGGSRGSNGGSTLARAEQPTGWWNLRGPQNPVAAGGSAAQSGLFAYRSRRQAPPPPPAPTGEQPARASDDARTLAGDAVAALAAATAVTDSDAAAAEAFDLAFDGSGGSDNGGGGSTGGSSSSRRSSAHLAATTTVLQHHPGAANVAVVEVPLRIANATPLDDDAMVAVFPMSTTTATQQTAGAAAAAAAAATADIADIVSRAAIQAAADARAAVPPLPQGSPQPTGGGGAVMLGPTATTTSTVAATAPPPSLRPSMAPSDVTMAPLPPCPSTTPSSSTIDAPQPFVAAAATTTLTLPSPPRLAPDTGASPGLSTANPAAAPVAPQQPQPQQAIAPSEAPRVAQGAYDPRHDVSVDGADIPFDDQLQIRPGDLIVVS